MDGHDGITKGELLEYLKTTFHPGMSSDDIKALKPGYRGSITGVVVLLTKITNTIANRTKTKVGWSYHRIHVRVLMARCSHCLDFSHRNYGLETSIRDANGRILIAGDLNAKSSE